MTPKLESAIISHDTHHRITCFDKVQLTIKWTSDIKDAHWSMDTTSFFDFEVRTRPRSIWLAMLTMTN